MTAKPDIIQPIIYLDTNCIHYMRLFFSYMEHVGIPPDNPGDFDFPSEVKRKYGKLSSITESILKGRKAYEYISLKLVSERRVSYSPITRIETLCGILRGKAIVSAAEEGIPNRMWNRINEHEILFRILPIKPGDHIDLVELFNRNGIELVESDPGRILDIWSLAHQILEQVFFDVSDSIVYASAIIDQADEFLTSDGYLKKLINLIYNPGGSQDEALRDYFRGVNASLIKIMTDHLDYQAILPSAHSPE